MAMWNDSVWLEREKAGEGGKWREVVGRWFGRWVPIERECPETYFQPPSGDRIGLFCYYTSQVSND